MRNSYACLPKIYEEILKLSKVLAVSCSEIKKDSNQKNQLSELFKESLFLIQHLVDLFLNINSIHAADSWQQFLVCLSRCNALADMLAEMPEHPHRTIILLIKRKLREIEIEITNYIKVHGCSAKNAVPAQVSM